MMPIPWGPPCVALSPSKTRGKCWEANSLGAEDEYLNDTHGHLHKSCSYVCIWVCLKMLCKPLNPMVLLIIIPMINGYNWEFTLFSDKAIYIYIVMIAGCAMVDLYRSKSKGFLMNISVLSGEPSGFWAC